MKIDTFFVSSPSALSEGEGTERGLYIYKLATNQSPTSLVE